MLLCAAAYHVRVIGWRTWAHNNRTVVQSHGELRNEEKQMGWSVNNGGIAYSLDDML